MAIVSRNTMGQTSSKTRKVFKKKPIRKLGENDYRTRAWVVQEVLLASDSVAVYNNGILPLYIGSYWTKLNRAHHLGDLLLAMGNQRCAEPRDRLFAIRGLLYEAEARDIVVDYNVDIEDVFLTQAYSMLRWLLVLEHVENLAIALEVEFQCCCHHQLMAYLDIHHQNELSACSREDNTTPTNATSVANFANEDLLYYIVARPLGHLPRRRWLRRRWSSQSHEPLFFCNVMVAGVHCRDALRDGYASLRRSDVRLVSAGVKHVAFRVTKDNKSTHSVPMPDTIDFSKFSIDVDHLMDDGKSRVP